jgi:ribosomal protein S12 methylthiotransferase
MPDKTFHLISLGCAKNTVDSESIGQLLVHDGYAHTIEPDQAEILIVNTCGFIGPAKEESYQALSELAANKSDSQLLIAAGCLTQRYGAEVLERVPEIDGVLGTRRWMDILELVNNLRSGKHPEPLYHLPSDALTVGTDEKGIPRISRDGPSAYIKIADGCRRPCAFCAIPLIKGTVASRPIEVITHDARLLHQNGVREIILIAQDTTDYGHDLGLKHGLPKLINNITESVPEIDWIRIMYAYPGYVSDELIDTMASQQQVLPYLDIPLQHGHPDTLRRMRRPANIEWVHKTIGKMRDAMPNLAIRSTFIVGYPGETEKEFQTLLDFIEDLKFDRVGAFTFSFEPGTTSEPLGDPVPEEIKQERLDRLMTLQQEISLQNNQSFIDQTLDVLIEGFTEPAENGSQLVIGRSYRDAPEIDGLVFVDPHPQAHHKFQIGQIVPVKITGAMIYDLTGTHNPEIL